MKSTIFWMRRDLRLEDTIGLSEACKTKRVIPLFIFDASILQELTQTHDARVSFIYQQVKQLKNELQALGSDLRVYHGIPLEIFKQLTENLSIEAVYCNEDYEPYALQRDQEVQTYLQTKSIPFYGFKDHVLMAKDELLKNDGTPYTVFTPYSKKWHSLFHPNALHEAIVNKTAFARLEPQKLLELSELGFEPSALQIPNPILEPSILAQYGTERDRLEGIGTTYWGTHLRFGTLSIRKAYALAFESSSTLVNELIWREFYAQILFHFPHVVYQCFKKEYEAVTWEQNELHFKAWCEGKTGYPLVDAAMRCIYQTGLMPNRLRMVVGSFLTKHLGMDWRLGAAYFAEHLLDYELASNNGGWQWCSSTGCDAVPYFRIFNPQLQQEKFDSHFKFIKKWVPEFGTKAYPQPIVDHKTAREAAIQRFKILK